MCSRATAASCSAARRSCNACGARTPTSPCAASTRSPQELADLVARDVSEALTEHPDLDLEGFIRQRFDVRQAFVVLMHDGRRVAHRPSILPPGFGERRRGAGFGGFGRGGPPPPDAADFPPPPEQRDDA